MTYYVKELLFEGSKLYKSETTFGCLMQILYKEVAKLWLKKGLEFVSFISVSRNDLDTWFLEEVKREKPTTWYYDCIKYRNEAIKKFSDIESFALTSEINYNENEAVNYIVTYIDDKIGWIKITIQPIYKMTCENEETFRKYVKSREFSYKTKFKILYKEENNKIRFVLFNNKCWIEFNLKPELEENIKNIIKTKVRKEYWHRIYLALTLRKYVKYELSRLFELKTKREFIVDLFKSGMRKWVIEDEKLNEEEQKDVLNVLNEIIKMS